MRDPERIDVILDKLSVVWHANPDLRLGQIIECAQNTSGSSANTFYIEDDDIAKGLQRLTEE